MKNPYGARGSIAILGTRGIPAGYGGFETFAEALAVGLVGRGWQVTVYCETDGPDRGSEYKGVRLIHLPSGDLGPASTLVFDFRCLWHARKDFDFVYMLGYGASFGCFLPRLWGSRVLINMDGLEWRRSKWGALGRLWLRIMEWLATVTASHLIADAEGIRDYLQKSYRRLPGCTVIPYGAELVSDAADPSYLDEYGLAADDYYLIVARIEPENHVREIVEGYLASESAAPLVVVGGIERGTRYIQELLAFECERVSFLSGIYHKEKLAALRYFAKAYFHGHSVGGTNPSLLEAMGCGNIIVAHDNPFTREVTGGGAFFFASADNIPAIIGEIENGGDRLSAMKSVIDERVRNVYTWERVVTLYEELLGKELAGRS